MHSRKNCQQHIWLLTGTGEGPPLAKALLSKGWKVSVSVVSYEASLSYFGLKLESLLIGPLDGIKGICSVLETARSKHNGFDCVVDVTHPFAKLISFNLLSACLKYRQRLIRFERVCDPLPKAKLINNFRDLEKFDLYKKKILLAIGSKYLFDAVNSLEKLGAVPFARVLPKVSSLKESLSCRLDQSHLAAVHPLNTTKNLNIEEALCRKWCVDGVICKQSGGESQRNWQSICQKQKIDLWLLARPEYNYPKDIEVVRDFESLFDILLT